MVAILVAIMVTITVAITVDIGKAIMLSLTVCISRVYDGVHNMYIVASFYGKCNTQSSRAPKKKNCDFKST
jgi:hypothetical protein